MTQLSNIEEKILEYSPEAEIEFPQAEESATDFFISEEAEEEALPDETYIPAEIEMPIEEAPKIDCPIIDQPISEDAPIDQDTIEFSETPEDLEASGEPEFVRAYYSYDAEAGVYQWERETPVWTLEESIPLVRFGDEWISLEDHEAMLKAQVSEGFLL